MERKNTFNEIAREYDKYRPDYPEQLFTDILEYSSLNPYDKILEIGCGTGQATKGFVQSGYCHITGIELGEHLADLTREKFKDIPTVKIIHSPFETWQNEGTSFHLAISGTAFHFIQPQDYGYRKVFDLLGSQGSIAFFWTVHVPSYDNLSNQIRDIYRRCAPQLDDSTNPSMQQIIEERSNAILKEGLYKDLEVKQYRWDDPYSAREYVSLLNTNSRHRLLPEDIRSRLLGEIGEAIEKKGGTIHKPQAVVLFLAKKNGAKKDD
ncbi:class I SAM-dependent methyltransferase [Paenibacillus sp. N4]|uniref:class I SAM-dependent methyltransferase n=1 Tax=Paenibacillus vietnamensis TaxID=2590547 RepID=UPI001CD14299|nr:class I SAM-dependent methyltransferase [Paenibacillus vietnamensis]MCA0757144.1 class I SAM-dependent methyltransferase [Paenibacillus vietnamensis]